MQLACDPKMLLPPLQTDQLAAFQLTALEKEIKRDALFPPDLGININALDIERFSVVSTAPNQEIDAADASLLDDTGEAATALTSSRAGGRSTASALAQRVRQRRENVADVTWLMRTKYITNDYSQVQVPASKRRKPQQDDIEEQVQVEEQELVEEQKGGRDERQAQIAAIEASFAAAHHPPTHPKNPTAVPLLQLPILPDELLEDWSLVQAQFDGNPASDVAALKGLSEEEKKQTVLASQLKSFVRRRGDDSIDRFVAWLLPARPPPSIDVDNGNSEGTNPFALKAGQLGGDYRWIREYDSQVKYDEKGQTYLFRIGKDCVGYADLNTKVALRKRKKSGGGNEEDEDGGFLQPEKFILQVEEEEEQGQGAMEVDAGEQQQEQEQVAAMRNVFGSDSEDDG